MLGLVILAIYITLLVYLFDFVLECYANIAMLPGLGKMSSFEMPHIYGYCSDPDKLYRFKVVKKYHPISYLQNMNENIGGQKKIFLSFFLSAWWLALSWLFISLRYATLHIATQLWHPFVRLDLEGGSLKKYTKNVGKFATIANETNLLFSSAYSVLSGAVF